MKQRKGESNGERRGTTERKTKTDKRGRRDRSDLHLLQVSSKLWLYPRLNTGQNTRTVSFKGFIRLKYRDTHTHIHTHTHSHTHAAAKLYSSRLNMIASNQRMCIFD